VCGRGKKSSAKEQALGRSRGGFSTKVHALTDALGYPIKFILTGGQESDIGQAENLLTGIEAGALLADKGYDADVLLESLKKNSVDAVIPPKANRTVQRHCDWYLYKERHLIECFFGKIKHYRRIFSRYEKLAANYMSFLSFVGALIWLR
jgi:transposase